MKKIKHTRNRRKILDEKGVYVQNQSLKAELLQTQGANYQINAMAMYSDSYVSYISMILFSIS